MSANDELISIAPEDPSSEAAARMIRDLSAYLAGIYSDFNDDGSGSFTLADVRVPRSIFLVARIGTQAVGCGALRPMDEQAAEVKRMYVAETARRKGIGRLLLAELERYAREFGYRFLRLETGVRQKEAMALYERYGFYRIPQYGEFAGNDLSACYEKEVSA